MKRILFLSLILSLILLILFILTYNAFAITRTISWDPVTTYTDNTSIEPEKLPVTYIIKMDNVVICIVITVTSCTFEQMDHSVSHKFNAKATLFTGEESVWSPEYLWFSPPIPTESPSIPRIH